MNWSRIYHTGWWARQKFCRHQTPQKLELISRPWTSPKKPHVWRVISHKYLLFLTSLIKEAVILNMSEAEYSITFPTFLFNPAETQFRINLSKASSHGGIVYWPKSQHYIFRTDASTSAVRHVLKDLFKVKQKADEKEKQCLKRFNEATFKWVNVHSEDEKTKLYVDGLSPRNNIVLTPRRKSVHFTTKSVIQPPPKYYL